MSPRPATARQRPSALSCRPDLAVVVVKGRGCGIEVAAEALGVEAPGLQANGCTIGVMEPAQVTAVTAGTHVSWTARVAPWKTADDTAIEALE